MGKTKIETEFTEHVSSPIEYARKATASWGVQSPALLPGEVFLPIELPSKKEKDEEGNRIYEKTHYAVSNFGRIKSYCRRGRRPKSGYGDEEYQGHFLRTGLSNAKDVVVALRDIHKNQRICRVATLVLTAFVGPPDEGMGPVYEDGDRSNPQLQNLHWGVRSRAKKWVWEDSKWTGRQFQEKLAAIEEAYKTKLEETRAMIGGEQGQELRWGGESALRDRWLEVVDKLSAVQDKEAKIGDIVRKIESFLWRN